MRENLRKARKAAGMTQQAMADKLKISLVYYQKIEAGDRTGDYWIWDTLEDITGIHPVSYTHLTLPTILLV